MNGVRNIQESIFLFLKSLVSAETSNSEKRYGFLPSDGSSAAVGKIFLILVLVHLMFLVAKLSLSGGNKKRLGILFSGIVGGLALVLFSSLPNRGKITNEIDRVGNAREQIYLIFENLVWSDNCEKTYGFLPCSTTALGNKFLILAYGYLMFWAAKLLSEGCEILLEILGPGIIGGLVLPILSSLPDAIIILASGLSGSKETAQDQVSVGMGLLAGSIVMLLTLLWGSCIVVGKCDLEDTVAKDGEDTKGFSLTASGVSTDIWTSYAARIMVVSVMPFVVVQLPMVFNKTSESQLPVLTALVLSIYFLISYCLYQVFQPKVQKRRLAFAKYKHVMSVILTDFKTRTLGRILTIDGRPDREVLEKLFKVLDVNNDGNLSAEELRTLILGIRFNDTDLDRYDIDEAVTSILKEFDKTDDSLIDEEEFINGISDWIYKAKRSAKHESDECPGSPQLRFLSEFYQQTRKEHDLLGDESSDDDERSMKDPKWNAFKAVMMLLLGTTVVCVFANPLVDVVNNFSTATKVPKFFVSFVVLPFASCSEAVSALIFVRHKRQKTASLTFSQLNYCTGTAAGTSTSTEPPKFWCCCTEIAAATGTAAVGTSTSIDTLKKKKPNTQPPKFLALDFNLH
ncbi:Sodium/calcium exchanger NCL [Camellia lanceoleosa]|uniref:Sodium/calcium exchanger NCL n=1 Tax=Camellia lanceoleosa TaxID=1840588 RepID=A0ACC0HCK4_9ERIC|nr:Sodium/calcium exchanger NCL [Camellia lanceoleosa]